MRKFVLAVLLLALAASPAYAYTADDNLLTLPLVLWEDLVEFGQVMVRLSGSGTGQVIVLGILIIEGCGLQRQFWGGIARSGVPRAGGRALRQTWRLFRMR